MMQRNNEPTQYRGPLQAVILDWAGTIIDYGSCAPAAAFVDVFLRFGIEITMAEAREPMEKRSAITLHPSLKCRRSVPDGNKHTRRPPAMKMSIGVTKSGNLVGLSLEAVELVTSPHEQYQ